MSALHPTLRATIEEFLDANPPEVVDATVAFLRALGPAQRMYAGEFVEQVRAELDAAEA